MQKGQYTSVQQGPYSLFFYVEVLVRDDSARRWVCTTQPSCRPPSCFLKYSLASIPHTVRWITYYRRTAYCGQGAALLGHWIHLGQKGFHLSSICRGSPAKQWLPHSFTVWRMTTRQRPVWSDHQQIWQPTVIPSHQKSQKKHNPGWGNLIFWVLAD